MGVIELLVIGTIAGLITTARSAKSVVNATTDLVHARKGTKPTAREPHGFGKYWRQAWEDEAAKHAIKERKRRQRLNDDNHVTVGDWWAKMRSEARRKAMAKRGMKTDEDIARAARRHAERMEREGLTPYAPNRPVPDLETERQPNPRPTIPTAGGGQAPYSPFGPAAGPGERSPNTQSEPSTPDAARTQVEDLAKRLAQTERELAEANKALQKARAEAAAAASREGLAGYADAARKHEEQLRHAEEVAQRLAADRARLATELAEAQQRLDLIAQAWEARRPGHSEGGCNTSDNFGGTVIDGEVVPQTETTETGGAVAPLEQTKAIMNGTEHHMSGEVTTLETTKPFVEGMTAQAGGSLGLLEAAQSQLANLAQLSTTFDEARVSLENAAAKLREAEVAESFTAQINAAREHYAIAKANVDTVVATAENLATASEQLAAAQSVFEDLEAEVAGHISAAEKVAATSTGGLSYMGINRDS